MVTEHACVVSMCAHVRASPCAPRICMQMAGIPFLKNFASVKVTETSVYRKGQELVEDLKDKYETSDHPAVHKVRMHTQSPTNGCAWACA